jgi:hypothetical protein
MGSGILALHEIKDWNLKAIEVNRLYLVSRPNAQASQSTHHFAVDRASALWFIFAEFLEARIIAPPQFPEEVLQIHRGIYLSTSFGGVEPTTGSKLK